MKKAVLSLFVVFIWTINVYADGPLMMKGFHHDIPFDKACEILSEFKSERGDFIYDEKQKKCGFGRNNLITYPYIKENITSKKIDTIVLSPDVVDYLFDAKSLNVRKFCRIFLKKYSWIDKFNMARKYQQTSPQYGWKLSIDKKKWMKITFFKENKTHQ
ncbi:hypothetical protein [Sulfurovum sp. NBC37-1]|uniref:hypothetical protein n=1 Tax=Sulfurovum sp. (strain NBC37-1) TaxID=387093 RepID=UPI00015876C7|nr:hypothetical protein [Sulfurovum sp. NBC37-1]BAF71570.1 hypothetical protein SUN_0611 [Sulfurovum sp. NBC37-1]